MTKAAQLQHIFVEHIPENLEEGRLYVSMQFGTVVHKCCCGCGEEVVTPLAPTDWKLTFDGESVSLYPSIGNWSFDCRSHYWIKGNRVAWAGQCSQGEVEAGRRSDRLKKRQHFAGRDHAHEAGNAREVAGKQETIGAAPEGGGRLSQLWRWVFGS